MDGWKLLLELVIALSAALVLGLVFEKLKLGAIVGYIVAGVGVGAASRGTFGPNSPIPEFSQPQDSLYLVAELGIAILMFTTGLEFSVLRLRKLGRSTYLAGLSQVIASVIVFGGIATAFGIGWKSAVAIGAICAVSSTAIVIRTLRDRADLDAPHGKTSFGILLIQDVALVPLVLLITALGGVRTSSTQAQSLQAISGVALICAIFVIAIVFVVPRIFRSRTMAANRDLPILLAVITCAGAAWCAHAVGLSPSLGAFLAGMLLAESAFEHQIRSDMAGLRSVLVTLFFLSVGVMIDVRWVANNWSTVLLAFAIVLAGKTIANFAAIRLWKRSTIPAFAASLCLANVGELGFVLLQVAAGNKLLSASQAQLMTSVTVLTMVAAPILISISHPISRKLAIALVPGRKLVLEERSERMASLSKHFVVFGFGTAGKTASAILSEAQYECLAVDLDPKFRTYAKEHGVLPIVGDATRVDLLEELHLNNARAAIIAIPDHRTAAHVVALVKEIAPELPIVARSRVHQFREELVSAGATLVVGEEQLLGRRLGEEAVRLSVGIDEDILGMA